MPPGQTNLATWTLAYASGTEVPAAKKVMPMMLSGMPSVNPISVTIHTIMYEKTAVQVIEAKKVIKNLLGSCLQSGTV